MEWIKSAYSGSNGGGCVEVRTDTYQTARAVGVREEALKHDEVQKAVAAGQRLILMRDSKNPAGPVLAFTVHEWSCFLRSVREGEFDDMLVTPVVA